MNPSTPNKTSPPGSPRSWTPPRSGQTTPLPQERAPLPHSHGTDPLPEPPGQEPAIDQPLPTLSDESPWLSPNKPIELEPHRWSEMSGDWLMKPAPEAFRDRIEATEAEQVQDIVSCVDQLLALWPDTAPVEQPQAMESRLPTTETGNAQDQPFHWDQLPHDVQRLVLHALFGRADQVKTKQHAAQLRHAFAQLLRVSKTLHGMVQTHHNRVLLCALRLAPMNPSQLQGTPLHRLLSHAQQPQAASYPLMRMLKALAKASARLRSERQVSQAALALGKQLLQALLSVQATAQDRRVLLLAPVFTVQALRMRAHRQNLQTEEIGSALRGLADWADQQELGLALPVLLEILYTVERIREHELYDTREGFDCDQLYIDVDKLIDMRQTWSYVHDLVNSIRFLATRLVPHPLDPWSTEEAVQMCTVYHWQEDLSQAMELLANYPFAFVGFASEALACLQDLAWNGLLTEQQIHLLRRCEERQQHPLDRPAPTGDH